MIMDPMKWPYQYKSRIFFSDILRINYKLQASILGEAGGNVCMGPGGQWGSCKNQGLDR